jgi:DNA-binding NarL/FixJ family response regulator
VLAATRGQASTGQGGIPIAVVADDVVVANGMGRLLEATGALRAHCLASIESFARELDAVPPRALIWFTRRAADPELSRFVELGAGQGFPVCVIASRASARAVREAYAAGAERLSVVLLKRDLRASDVARVLGQVLAGRVVLSPALLSELLLGDPSGAKGVLATLTARERHVLELMACGLRNRTIARRLGRSEKLVEKHVGRIFEKLGVREDSELDRRVSAVRLYLALEADVDVTEPNGNGHAR